MKQDKTIRAYCLYILGRMADKAGCHELAIMLLGRAAHLKGDVDKFHNSLGIALRSRGRLDEALACHQRALAINADNAKTHYNIGCVHQLQGRLDEAIANYDRALALKPAYARACYNLGNAFASQYRFGDAAAQYKRAFEIDPSFFEADDNRRAALKILDGMKSEILEFQRALAVKPERSLHSKLRQGLALMQVAGEREWAIGQAREWVKNFPDNSIATYTLAALAGNDSDAPLRAPDYYIENIFDNYAEEFDEILTSLGYRAPALIGEVLARELSATGLDVLDIGCGTGLAGIFLRPWARVLTGVDLSKEMLAQAAKRKLYDHLHKGELTEFLTAHPASFDLIAAADVLIYGGDLMPPLSAAAAALRRGGRISFTVERYFDENAQGWRLLHHGRYCHSESYLRRCLAGCDLAVVSITPGVLRRETGHDVDGLVVLARRDAQ